ncbi:PH domain-containing protein [Lentibacillus sp. Marseille-P4043]|uniref:PH domain-containing protein n=1 Tax=Lentibacillus sp. Marseille-P4043 TaxID=2040293 RepID=UPI000D0AC4E8|nr:PH domain-containing protein [Lentibacillus sp. Marseille-P4043]
MYENIKEPDRRIARDAISVWRLANLLGHLLVLIVIAVLLVLDYKLDWYNWVSYVLWICLGVDWISAIWSVGIEPVLIQKYWRYGIDEEFVKLRHGRWIAHHQLIPMTKVQYVGLKQGPLFRRFDLYTLSIGTMGSKHDIPAIPKEEALALRDEIATLAKVKEVED